MISFSLFILSGAVIVTLTAAKRMEGKRKTNVFLFKFIAKADTHVRELHHKSLHFYSEGKDKFLFVVKKQLPLRLKSHFYKTITFIKGKVMGYTGDMRNSRLLKRSDGISEFFKNISEIEKGAGEINEPYIEEPIAPVTAPVMERIEEPAPEVSAPKPRRKRAPARRKIQVIELE